MVIYLDILVLHGLKCFEKRIAFTQPLSVEKYFLLRLGNGLNFDLVLWIILVQIAVCSDIVFLKGEVVSFTDCALDPLRAETPLKLLCGQRC
jgi:hypothetical protein